MKFQLPISSTNTNDNDANKFTFETILIDFHHAKAIESRTKISAMELLSGNNLFVIFYDYNFGNKFESISLVPLG